MLIQYCEILWVLIGVDVQSMLVIYLVVLLVFQEMLLLLFFFELLVCCLDLQVLCGYVIVFLSQVDVVKVVFYFYFDIKVFWGYNVLSVGDLFKFFFQQINLLFGLYLLIFDGGCLNVNLQLVCIVSNILIKQYNQVVLDVVCDVVISFSQFNDLNQQCVLQQLKVIVVQIIIDSVCVYYQCGFFSCYVVEEVCWVVFVQQLLLLDIEVQWLSIDIILIKVLGGGY